MPELHNREKVLVQYRLLKDFDDLRRRGIPGIDVRVMEDNIYEWHVTMSPISGHFSGLRIHMVLLLPEDYPRKPPKVELYNFLPHANVFRDFLQSTSLAWASYWRGSSPARGKYVLCTDLLEMKPHSGRHEGWSPSYSVEAVLVQLQCLLFDDYVHSDHGQHINTLWDTWYARPGQGRKSRQQVCAELHQAQLDADAFYCPACGYRGDDDSVAFYDSPEAIKSSDEESESEAEQCEEQKGTKREHTFVSRKKQKKRELEKLKVATKDPKVDFKQQRRVPGVFRVRDVVYLNGQLCINRDLQIFNYGHEVEYPWRWYDPMLGRFVYRQQQPPEEEEEKKTGKVVWERNGGGKLKAEDTPGTEAFVKKREQFYAVGVVESVNPHTCTVSIVIVENDATMGEWAFNSEQHSSGLKATLYKNIPMEKACLHGYEGFVAPYDHPPPAVYKPVPGHYTAEESVVSEQSGSLSHSFHVVPSGLSALSSSLGSYDLVPSQAPSQAGSVASRISAASERSLLTLRSAHLDFGAFVSLDATPRDLAVQNKKLVSGGRLPKGKGKSKGKGKGKSDGETKMLQDGLLPCLPYMRPSWPPRSAGEQGSSRDSSVMVNGNVFEQMGRQTLGPAEVVVYISEVDVNQRRMKLSLQPRLTFEELRELRIGGKHEGIVVDTSHLGLFVALSDSLVGLLPRAQLGVGAFAEGPEEVYKRGDIVTVWVLRKALADANSRRKYKIDLTMDKCPCSVSLGFRV
ncbi:UBC2 [Symbiodinium sp. CCMP2456]|nr:UBC2 [Symbiodinium sp. CCMP2456]